MRMIEQHELAAICGGDGMPQVTICRQRDDSSATAKAPTIQIYGCAGSNSSGGSNSGGGGAATSPAPAKPTKTTTETVAEVCTGPGPSEFSFGVQGFTIKKTPASCKTTRSFTTIETK